jgi:hypothetical protein
MATFLHINPFATGATFTAPVATRAETADRAAWRGALAGRCVR